MEWHPPSGFRVVQDYRASKIERPEFVLADGRRVRYRISTSTGERDIPGSERAAVANFVHSLDASFATFCLVALAASGVRDVGLAHDSFSTSANNGGALYTVPRIVARAVGRGRPLDQMLGGRLADLVQNGAEFDELPMEFLTT
jgi:DNA-directed RNA polymerase